MQQEMITNSVYIVFLSSYFLGSIENLRVKRDVACGECEGEMVKSRLLQCEIDDSTAKTAHESKTSVRILPAHSMTRDLSSRSRQSSAAEKSAVGLPLRPLS